MWVNYEYLDNSFVGQYFKADCDVIAITMATLKVHKKNLPNFSFRQLSEKLRWWPALFIEFLENS